MSPIEVPMILKGLSTYVPGLHEALRRPSAGSCGATYCYGVWLKHLSISGDRLAFGGTVAELGPGESLGLGISALLSGADRYYALDVVRHTDTRRNLQVFDELVELFRRRSPRPHKGWPDYDSYLDERLFPSRVLTEDRLARSLDPARLEWLRAAVEHPESEDSPIRYVVPWHSDTGLLPESIDVFVSHSALEHVVDLERTYQALSKWLKPGGLMSHQIDLAAHTTSKAWNGHRAYPEWLWTLTVGRKPYLLNREPCSVHVNLVRSLGMSIVLELHNHRSDGLPRNTLARRWRDISAHDLTCSGLFLQAIKAARG